MNAERITELIGKYNAMLADPSELMEIERLIENGDISLDDLQEIKAIEEGVFNIESPSPSLMLDDKFYEMLQRERMGKVAVYWKRFFAWPEFAPRLVLGSFMLILGLAAGFFLRPRAGENQQIAVLGKEVSNLKELIVLSLLEKESATDRLKAVNITHDMDQSSQKVTQALLRTLNNDENVNVRLAALDALRAYINDGKVREGLIRAIANQDSPLVQISLAEIMASIHAKSSVKELEKILRDNNTPPEVKEKIRESISVLI